MNKKFEKSKSDIENKNYVKEALSKDEKISGKEKTNENQLSNDPLPFGFPIRCDGKTFELISSNYLVKTIFKIDDDDAQIKEASFSDSYGNEKNSKIKVENKVTKNFSVAGVIKEPISFFVNLDSILDADKFKKTFSFWKNNKNNLEKMETEFDIIIKDIKMKDIEKAEKKGILYFLNKNAISSDPQKDLICEITTDFEKTAKDKKNQLEKHYLFLNLFKKLEGNDINIDIKNREKKSISLSAKNQKIYIIITNGDRNFIINLADQFKKYTKIEEEEKDNSIINLSNKEIKSMFTTFLNSKIPVALLYVPKFFLSDFIDKNYFKKYDAKNVNEKIEMLSKENAEIKKENAGIKKENAEHKAKIEMLSNENAEQNAKIETLSKENDEIKKENAEQKSKIEKLSKNIETISKDNANMKILIKELYGLIKNCKCNKKESENEKK